MNPLIRNILGISTIIAVLLGGFAVARIAGTFDKSIDPSSLRSFAVSGEGRVVAVPDIAQFTFSVITQGGADIAKLQQDNVEKTNRVIAFLKGEGVDEKDIKTQSFHLEPRYQYFSCGPSRIGGPEACPPPEIVGYSITQSVSVKVRDFGKVGRVLGGAVDNGANSVSQLNFTVDDPTELENEARKQAMDKARTKAEGIAEAGGFRVGQLLSIDEGGYYPPQPYYERAFAADGIGGGGAVPQVEPGSQEIIVNVTLRFAIE